MEKYYILRGGQAQSENWIREWYKVVTMGYLEVPKQWLDDKSPPPKIFLVVT